MVIAGYEALKDIENCIKVHFQLTSIIFSHFTLNESGQQHSKPWGGLLGFLYTHSTRIWHVPPAFDSHRSRSERKARASRCSIELTFFQSCDINHSRRRLEISRSLWTSSRAATKVRDLLQRWVDILLFCDALYRTLWSWKTHSVDRLRLTPNSIHWTLAWIHLTQRAMNTRWLKGLYHLTTLMVREFLLDVVICTIPTDQPTPTFRWSCWTSSLLRKTCLSRRILEITRFFGMDLDLPTGSGSSARDCALPRPKHLAQDICSRWYFFYHFRNNLARVGLAKESTLQTWWAKAQTTALPASPTTLELCFFAKWP